jgi:hypothetical protein
MAITRRLSALGGKKSRSLSGTAPSRMGQRVSYSFFFANLLERSSMAKRGIPITLMFHA